MEPTKTCNKCEVSKPVGEFNKRTLKSGTVTLQTNCRACQKAYAQTNKDRLNANCKEYWTKNKEAMHAKQREYYQNNKEKHRAGCDAWAKANPEKVRAIGRATYHRQAAKERARQKVKFQRDKEKLRPTRQAWKKANPEKVRTHDNNRRARELNAEGSFTAGEWLDRLAEFNNHCAYCLKPLTAVEIEHMNPLARGGSNNIDNLVPACPPCNRKKHDKNLLEFAREATSAPFLAVGAVA